MESIIVSLSVKSSLVLGENKAAYCREGHIRKVEATRDGFWGVGGRVLICTGWCPDANFTSDLFVL